MILAHNYQRGEVQDIADYTGDSLGLSMKAVEVDAKVIVFCGVDFMAESAAILNPGKTVLNPKPEARCPMAEMITQEALRAFKHEHPGAATVCYVNSSAAVKAESDICCTSSNSIILAIMPGIFQNNVIKCFIIRASGLAFGIAPMLFIIANGPVIGIVVGATLMKAGIIYVLVGIVPHGVTELPMMFISAAIGLKLWL